nr:SDR family NAD(P)-dependent oxidoreductase [Escherichia coli]
MNAFSLHNKTALITGAASGLGLAMAKCMIVSGAKVIIADLNGGDRRNIGVAGQLDTNGCRGYRSRAGKS